MRRFNFLLIAMALLSGCEPLNDALVRQWHKDSGLGRRVRNQINEGLDRRRTAPPKVGPAFPAPPSLNQG